MNIRNSDTGIFLVHTDLFRNNEKALKLMGVLKNLGNPLYIACSGGLDSRFLAFFAQAVGIKDIILLHIQGTHIDEQESADLQNWARLHGFSLKNIDMDVLSNEEIKNNSPLRCYHCKQISFSHMLSFCESHTLCDGTHFDDSKNHRPGMKALKELKVRSPLLESGFTKADIREMAETIGLDNPKQKAKPCILTRFNYNTVISEEKIKSISFAEKLLLELLEKQEEKGAIPDFRIREITLNRYEVHSVDIISPKVIEALQKVLQQANMFPIEYKQLNNLSGYFDTLNI